MNVTIIFGLLYTWTASCFLKEQLQGNSSEKGVFGGLLFFSYGILSCWAKKRNIPYILYAMCAHGLLVSLTLAVFKGEREKKLLAGVLLTVMTVLILNFSESLLCCGGLILLGIFAGGSHVTLTGVWAEKIITVITCIIWITCVNLLSNPLKPVFTDKSKHWFLCLAIPLSCMILVTDLVNWAASNGILVQDWERFGLYENQLFSHGAICIITGLAMTASGALVFGMDKIHREESARKEYQSKVLYYEMLKDQYSRMEGLRHDMKNHMIALENLVHGRQWERAGCYLKEMEEAGDIGFGEEAVGSLVIDALLSHKKRQAKEKNIRWQCDAKLPRDCPVKEMDLCIIVGNIVDNAWEACCRCQDENTDNEPFIQINIRKIKQCLFLEVRNSTDEREERDLHRTRKESCGEHGYGLVNIRAAAARYNGTVHTEMKDRIFTTSVLLPLCVMEQSGKS